MTKERKYREWDAKFLKVLTHIAIIVNLVAMYKSLFISHNNWWILMMVFVLYLTLRLYKISMLEKEARKRDMYLTEYIELLRKESK